MKNRDCAFEFAMEILYETNSVFASYITELMVNDDVYIVICFVLYKLVARFNEIDKF